MNSMIKKRLLGFISCIFLILTITTACDNPEATDLLRDPMFDEFATAKHTELLEADRSMENIDVVMLGDSHFEFMSMDFIPYTVFNLGIRGDTVKATILRTAEYSSIKKAKLIGLSLGTNNAALGIDETTTLQHLEQLLAALPSQTPILMGLLNPLSANKGFTEINEKLASLNLKLIEKYAHNTRVILIPPIKAFEKNDFILPEEFYMRGGIHLSELGYQKWNQRWLDAIESQMATNRLAP